MQIIILMIVAILVLIIFLFYKIMIQPKIALMRIKKKYGDQIQIIHEYGAGLLAKYHKSFVEDNDSMSFFRKMHVGQPNLKAMAFNIGSKVGYSFLDPQLIQLVHQQHYLFPKLDFNPCVSYLFQNSIVLESGKNWQRQRQFLGKSFHFEEIKNYFPSIKEICHNIFGQIREELEQSDQIGSKEIEVVKMCEKVTSEVVFRVFFGQSQSDIAIKRVDGSSTPVAHELVDVIRDTFTLIQTNKIALIKSILLKKKTFFVLPLKDEKLILDRLVALKATCNQVIETRKKQLIKNSSLYKYNFLDLYLKEMIINTNQDISYEEITDNFLSLYFAGTDTTGNMAGVALYYLSLNVQMQQQARDEIMSILSAKTSSTDPNVLYDSLTFEDFVNMNYIHSILKESLRLIPPAVGVFPRYANQDVQIGNFQVKKGDLVNTHFIYNQWNPEQFPNPEVFDPNRWMSTKDSRSAFSFTPFSQGPRNCIGQHLAIIEGKCMLAYILLNFHILPNPSQKLKIQMKIIYGIQNDNIVFFKKISNK